MSALLACLASVLVVQSDPLAADFERWFRGDLARDAELTTRVLNRLRARGKEEDGRRLLRVVRRKPRGRGETRVRDNLLRLLASRGTKLGIQTAFLAFIRKGSRIVAGRGQKAVRVHKDPATASRVLPLFGAFHASRYRVLLESFGRSKKPLLYMAAAEGLRSTGTPQAMSAIAAILEREDDLARGRRLVRLLVELLQGRSRSREARAVVIATAERKLRATDDIEWKRALVPLFRNERRKSTVPVLVGELERAFQRYRKPRKPVSTEITFWITEVHDLLRDLTGFTAKAGRPEVWRDFWEREKERFELWPEEKAIAARRKPIRGFFGIRVRGRKLTFMIDASPSMRRKMKGKGKKSRFERAKDEVRAMASRLEPDVKFNVIVFADEVLKFQRSPVTAAPWRLRALRTWLRKLPMGSETRLLDAFESCLEGNVAKTHNKFRRSLDEVFLISDGVPSDKPHRVLAGVSEWNVGRACRIHVVCLGPGDGGERRPDPFPRGGGPGVEFLRRIATQNRGEFRIVE